MPIITLSSTAKNGAVSRIVPTLRFGSGVVTGRGDVHCAITEQGIAYRHGRTLSQRVEALIQVADPGFRDGLEALTPAKPNCLRPTRLWWRCKAESR